MRVNYVGLHIGLLSTNTLHILGKHYKIYYSKNSITNQIVTIHKTLSLPSFEKKYTLHKLS